MADDMNNKSREEKIEDILSSLIRRADLESFENGVWPDSDTIIAYIENRANDSQQQEVHAALDGSPLFRSAFADILQCFETMETREAEARFDSMTVPDLPRVTGHIAQESKPKSSGMMVIIKDWLDRLSVKMLAPALAVGAAAVVIIMIWSGGDTVKLEHVYTFDQAFFASGEIKGDGNEALPEKLDSAVIREFRKYVTYDVFEEQYILKDTMTAIAAPVSMPLTVNFINENDSIVHMARLNVPSERFDSVRVSLLTVPEFALWSADLTPEHGESLLIEYQPAMGHAGIVVLSFIGRDTIPRLTGAVYNLNK